jgi:hypothetical protein
VGLLLVSNRTNAFRKSLLTWNEKPMNVNGKPNE